VDAYKRTTKKAIKEWTTAIGVRRGHEWLVVYVLPPTDASKPRKFNLSSLLDRLRADWNVGKRERCAVSPVPFLCTPTRRRWCL
jgi:trafficking protein particle complex subunit 10